MERTAEDWGRVAVALPGWRWMAGMHLCRPFPFCGGTVIDAGPIWHGEGPTQNGGGYQDVYPLPDAYPYPDDPATAGCLLALLGRAVRVVSEDTTCAPDWYYRAHVPFHLSHDGRGYGIAEPTLGRACIAAAEALGRWPGGGQ